MGSAATWRRERPCGVPDLQRSPVRRSRPLLTGRKCKRTRHAAQDHDRESQPHSPRPDRFRDDRCPQRFHRRRKRQGRGRPIYRGQCTSGAGERRNARRLRVSDGCALLARDPLQERRDAEGASSRRREERTGIVDWKVPRLVQPGVAHATATCNGAGATKTFTVIGQIIPPKIQLVKSGWTVRPIRTAAAVSATA